MSLAGRPLLEQDYRWIFVAEQGRHRLLEAATEQHGGANVLLLPAIEVAMAVTARAGQVLRDLGVAVIHHDALCFSAQLLPLGQTVGMRQGRRRVPPTGWPGRSRRSSPARCR